MSVETALAMWEGLVKASPHGCRIHIGGGEPFGRWETLIELARRAKAAGLGPLEAVETNAYWATDADVVRDRLAALDDAGLGRLTISADPYHQEFVPLERVCMAARVGREVLGRERVRIRWQDWVDSGTDTGVLPEPERRKVFAEWARRGRERLNGRAAVELAVFFQLMPPDRFADNSCAGRLLRSRHVHVDGDGIVCPGTCAGIVLGQVSTGQDVGRLWRALSEAFADGGAAVEGLEVVSQLAAGGPVRLLNDAASKGYKPEDGYAGKCQLCWVVRKWLFDSGYYPGQLGPEVVYRPGGLKVERT